MYSSTVILTINNLYISITKDLIFNLFIGRVLSFPIEIYRVVFSCVQVYSLQWNLHKPPMSYNRSFFLLIVCQVILQQLQTITGMHSWKLITNFFHIKYNLKLNKGKIMYIIQCSSITKHFINLVSFHSSSQNKTLSCKLLLKVTKLNYYYN